MMTLREINEAEARANAATPGPWLHERLIYSDGTPYTTSYLCWRFVEPAICGLYHGTSDPESTDADFIAAARTDVPALCAALREAWAERDELKKRVEWLEKANRSFSDVVLDM